MSNARRTAPQPDDDELARSSAPRRRGPHIGPLRITPGRVFLFVALLGGLGFLAYSIFFRDALQVPLMATGFAICGIAFAIAAFMSLAGVISAGHEGRDGTGVLHLARRRAARARRDGLPRGRRDHGHDLDGDQRGLTGTLGPPFPARAPIV